MDVVFFSREKPVQSIVGGIFAASYFARNIARCFVLQFAKPMQFPASQGIRAHRAKASSGTLCVHLHACVMCSNLTCIRNRRLGFCPGKIPLAKEETRHSSRNRMLSNEIVKSDGQHQGATRYSFAGYARGMLASMWETVTKNIDTFTRSRRKLTVSFMPKTRSVDRSELS